MKRFGSSSIPFSLASCSLLLSTTTFYVKCISQATLRTFNETEKGSKIHSKIRFLLCQQQQSQLFFLSFPFVVCRCSMEYTRQKQSITVNCSPLEHFRFLLLFTFSLIPCICNELSFACSFILLRPLLYVSHRMHYHPVPMIIIIRQFNFHFTRLSCVLPNFRICSAKNNCESVSS